MSKSLMAYVRVYPGLAFGLGLILSLPLLVAQSLAADTGLKNPSADSDDYAEWSNANRAYLSDNQRAREDRNPQQNDWYNFNFGVPAGATIDGIQVDVEGNNYWEANGVDIELSWDGGDTYTTSGKGLIWPISGSDSYQTFGGPTDTWGRTWSDSEFSNANFRVRLTKKGSEDYYEFDVDHIQIKVYFTESGTEPGMLVYGEGSIQEPRVRDWNGSSFGDETSAQTANNAIEWVVVRSSPDGTEMVMATVSTAAKELHVQTFDGVSWTSNWSTVMDYNGKRNIDVAYENNSGDVIVVFASSPGKEVEYRRRVGGTWDPSDQTFFTPAGGASANWIKLESRPASDDIFLGVMTTAPDLYAYRWSGSANTWGDQFTKDATVIQEKDTESFAITFEYGSGDAFFMWGDKNQEIDYREFTTSWQAETTAYTGLDGGVKWLVAAGDPSSDKIAISALTATIKYELGAWTGSNWVSRPASIDGRSNSERGLDVAFEKSSGKAMYIFNETSNIYQLSWCTWTSAGGFSGVTAETGSTLEVSFMQLYSDPSSNDLLAIYSEKGEGLYHRHWNGSTWTPLDTTLEASLSRVNGMEPFMFAPYSEMPNTSPTIASAIPDTTVNQDNEPIIGYRDLNSVFDDLEDGSALAFTVQSNSNPTLVTPSIDGADSTLALSFGPAQSGSSTIVIRATDSGSLWVEDAFVITVNATHVISGRVFEDINYGGGPGRDYATSLAQAGPFTIERDNVTVELYDAVGAFHSSTTTALDGSYSFTSLIPAMYTVRVVNSTVTSTRAGSNGTEILLQTFRVDGDGEGLGTGANKVGGERPSNEDADVNSSAQTLTSLQGVDDDLDGVIEWTQSIVTVDASGSDVTGVDFGFNADTIVNTNDREQGSLRQFILNTNLLTDQTNLSQANLTAGRESSIFMVPSNTDPLGRPVDPGFDAGRGIAVIAPASELEALVDSGTLLDGTIQTGNVGDTNPGVMGYLGPVGLGADGVVATGDEPTLSGVAAPEIELRGDATLEFGLRLQGSDITLRGMAIYGFGISGLDANILVGHHSLVTDNTNCRIEANVLGTKADTFVDPGPSVRSPAINIYVRTADQGVIAGNLLGYVGRENVRILSTALDWQVIGNEIRAGARETVFGGVTFIADATGEIKSNLIADDNATAVLGINTDLVIEDNTMTGNLDGAIGFFDNSGSRVTTASVSQNDLTGNGSGVVVLGENGASPAITGIRISRNRFGGNAHNAIDLAPSWTADGISTNDGTLLGDSSVANPCGSILTTGNIGLDTPLIDSAIITAGTTTIYGRACPGAEIEIYRAVADGDASDSSAGTDYGEGIEFLDATTADEAGDWTFATTALAVGDFVSAIAIDASDNTSEFGPNLMVSEFVLSGIVFEDADFAGTATDFDGGVADLPLVNVDVELYDGTTDAYLTSTSTTSGGIYGFGAVADGDYKVRVRSATIGDADTPPAGGYNATVPGTWPYPLPEMIWGYNSALIGGQDHTVDDSATGDNVGPGDTFVTVTVSGADVTGVNFGFCYELIVNVDDDANADSIRSKQGTLRQFIKNSNAISGVNKSWFQIP